MSATLKSHILERPALAHDENGHFWTFTHIGSELKMSAGPLSSGLRDNHSNSIHTSKGKLQSRNKKFSYSKRYVTFVLERIRTNCYILHDQNAIKYPI